RLVRSRPADLARWSTGLIDDLRQRVHAVVGVRADARLPLDDDLVGRVFPHLFVSARHAVVTGLVTLAAGGRAQSDPRSIRRATGSAQSPRERICAAARSTS